MVCALTAPAVEEKYERVHSDGNFESMGLNAFRRKKDAYSFNSLAEVIPQIQQTVNNNGKG
jgi:hypothetical protein